jgi:hypothetical protein
VRRAGSALRGGRHRQPVASLPSVPQLMPSMNMIYLFELLMIAKSHEHDLRK